MSDEEISVKFGAETSGIESGASRVRGSISDVSDEVTRAEELFKYLGERMLEVFALHEITEFVEKMAQMATQIERTAQMTGLSTDAVQELGYAAQITGGSAEGAATTIERLERNMVQASTGTGAAAKSFQSLGIEVKNADGTLRPVQAVLGDIADRFHTTEDGATKTYYAMTLMGRGGAELTPILDQGREGLAKLNDEFEKTGGKIGKETLDSLENVHKELVDMKSAVTGAEASITADFEPAIAVATEYVTNLAHGLKALVSLLTAIPDAAFRAGQAIGTAFKGESASSNSEGGSSGEWGGVSGDFGTAEQQKPSLPAPQADPTKDNTEQQLARERVAFEEEMGKLRIANEKSVLDSKVALGDISKKQEYAEEQNLADQEYALERAALENELQIDGLTVVQKQQINDKLLELDQKYQNQTAELTRKSVQDQTHQYDAMFKSIQQATDQMVNGILQGTQKWQQAMTRLIDNLVIKLVDDLAVAPVVKWVEQQALKLTTTQATDAAITASNTGQAAASSAAQGAANVAKVTGDSAVTFAGVFANLSALLGPAAAGPAAAAQATVLAQAPIASFDVGSNYVPQTGLAMVHQGETIIPASAQGDAYSGAGSNISVTFQIQAIDTQTGANFIQSNAASIANVVAGAIRNQNSSLTKALKG